MITSCTLSLMSLNTPSHAVSGGSSGASPGDDARGSDDYSFLIGIQSGTMIVEIYESVFGGLISLIDSGPSCKLVLSLNGLLHLESGLYQFLRGLVAAFTIGLEGEYLLSKSSLTSLIFGYRRFRCGLPYLLDSHFGGLLE